jgi:hypothetical protein
MLLQQNSLRIENWALPVWETSSRTAEIQARELEAQHPATFDERFLCRDLYWSGKSVSLELIAVKHSLVDQGVPDQQG